MLYCHTGSYTSRRGKNKNKLYIEKLMARKSLMTSWQNKGEKV